MKVTNKMNRYLTLIFFHIVFLFAVFGQQKEVQYALDCINQGYILAGVQALKDCSNHSNTWAQFFLGQCYEYGYGEEKNPKEAFLLYRKTAEKGFALGQYSVAKCYEQGFGTTINKEKSQMWINKSKGKFDSEDLYYLKSLFNNGLKYPENYAMNPIGISIGQGDNSMLAIQNNGNINSNNTIGSNNNTINNITIVQAGGALSSSTEPVTTQPSQPKSDVDVDIPETTQKRDNTFALIIANENYQDVARVPNAINDGVMFEEYCLKTLGLPSTNVIIVKDATYNNIKREIGRLSQIADAYNGSAKIIFYYAGHGVPNEATKDAFLLPVDGYGTDTSIGYSLNDLYSTLSNMPAEQVLVLLDACFSGTQRGNGMLASARGIAIKAKPNKVNGNMVVFSAAQGDETAYPYQEEGHGLFTYYLLKKLKETRGDVSLGELASYIKDNVSKKSIVVNGKSQTPNVNPSASLGESWRTWTLK